MLHGFANVKFVTTEDNIFYKDTLWFLTKFTNMVSRHIPARLQFNPPRQNSFKANSTVMLPSLQQLVTKNTITTSNELETKKVKGTSFDFPRRTRAAIERCRVLRRNPKKALEPQVKITVDWDKFPAPSNGSAHSCFSSEESEELFLTGLLEIAPNHGETLAQLFSYENESISVPKRRPSIFPRKRMMSQGQQDVFPAGYEVEELNNRKHSEEAEERQE